VCYSLPLSNTVIAGAYVFVVIVLKKFMMANEHIKFDLWAWRVVHNALLVALSAYMSFNLFMEAYKHHSGLFCNPVTEGEEGVHMMNVLWIFYASKIIEFVDTLIMCLRRNFRQITFLHTYHHASIFLIWWMNVYYNPGGECTCALLYVCVCVVLCVRVLASGNDEKNDTCSVLLLIYL
jgi:GNS1/SUR4 family